MAVTNTELMTRVARVFLEDQPSESTISAFADRIDNGEITRSEAIVEVYESGGRVTGNADELARLFFIMFGRAPDYTTFTNGMAMLEDGYSFVDLANVGLSMGFGRLSNALNLSNTAFVDNLANYMFTSPGSVTWLASLKSSIVATLEAGLMTRGQLLEIAANYDGTNLSYHQDVATSLLYMAALGRQASTQELALSRGISPTPVTRDALADASEDPFGERPYIELDDQVLTVKGNVVGDLVINFNTNVVTIDGVGTSKVVYSPDGGESESIVSLSRASIAGASALDMREISSNLDSVTFTTDTSDDTTFYGADTVNTVTAGSGDDTLVGNADVDTLTAGAGDDTLDGAAGNDVLRAGAGDDSLTGGAGNDKFIFAPASTYRNNTSDTTTIEDFGNGTDTLDFSVLFGNNTPAAATIISGNADRDSADFLADLVDLANNNVVLVSNTGVWLDETATDVGDLDARSRSQIADLFNKYVDANTAITFAEAPTFAQTYVVISQDPVNDADVWMISNFTNLTTIEAAEIQLIGHITSYADTDLWTTLINAEIFG